MFFFKRKTEATKRGLPPKLAELKHHDDVIWVWDPDYHLLSWANDKGMAFWDVSSRSELKELVFPRTHPLMMVSDTALRETKKGKIFSKLLNLKSHFSTEPLQCFFEAQELPDGRHGLLVRVKPKEKLHKTEETSDDDDDSHHDLEELSHIEYAHDEEEEDPHHTIQTSEETPLPEANSPLNNELLFKKPATFSTNNQGQIIGCDNIAIEMLGIKKGDNFTALFHDAQKGQEILNSALTINEYSALFIGHFLEHTAPFLIQTRRFTHDNQIVFNSGLIRVTPQQYADFLKKQETQIQPEQDSKIQTEEKPVSEITKLHPQDSSVQNEGIAPLLGVLENTDIAVLVTDNKGIIKTVNNYATQIMGLYETDIIGRPLHSLFHQSVSQRIVSAFASPQTIMPEFTDGVACEFMGQNNLMRTGTLMIRPHKQNTGHYWIILNDTTEIAELKREINELKKQPVAQATVPQALQEGKIPDLVSLISHEIRAPLNAISGYAELLENEVFGAFPDKRYKDFSHSIRMAGAYALEIVTDILDYTKLEAGGFIPVPTDVNLTDLISEAIELVSPMAQARHISISQTVLTGTPPIHVDGRLLKQVLVNLLSNGVKYSHENEQVYIAAGLTKTGRIMIEVTNYGKGMSKEQLEKAMQPFGRVNENDKIIGTGLGLPLAKRLSELTGGRFMIDSVVGERTRARIIYEADIVKN